MANAVSKAPCILDSYLPDFTPSFGGDGGAGVDNLDSNTVR